MSASSDIPNLNDPVIIPREQVAPEKLEPLLAPMGGAPPPEIAERVRRLSDDEAEKVKLAQERAKGAEPTRLEQMAPLLDPHHIKDKSFTLPGMDGVPFKGTVPNLKEDDPEHRRPQMGMEPHVYILNLANPTDLADYEGVMVLVANGYAVISVEEREYDADIKNWRVFLRWAMLVTFMPKQN